MDQLYLIISGIIVGLIAAAPIGPVNLICIRRSLAFGALNGFMVGLGAALGDTVFAVITAFGLTVISDLIRDFALYLQVGGGILLIFFGVHTYMTLPDPAREKKSSDEETATMIRLITSTFFLTMTNPATLFGFAAMFAGLSGLANVHASYVGAAFVVGGVAAGSTLWWFTLTAVVGLFHANINARVMKVINHGSGVVVALFGLAVLGHVAMKLLKI